MKFVIATYFGPFKTPHPFKVLHCVIRHIMQNLSTLSTKILSLICSKYLCSNFSESFVGAKYGHIGSHWTICGLNTLSYNQVSYLLVTVPDTPISQVMMGGEVIFQIRWQHIHFPLLNQMMMVSLFIYNNRIFSMICHMVLLFLWNRS